MGSQRSGFDFGAGFPFWGRGRGEWGPRRGRGRRPMFEAGEIKFVILRLLKDKPRHGYEIIKALEERMAGCYTPSPGTVYPTLQMLEDLGYVRGTADAAGKKVYEITPEGERSLEEHRDLLDEIVDRVRETVRDFTGGAIGELQGEFARVARTTFRHAWRRGPDDPAVKRVADILKRAADEIEQAWQTSTL
jgi:DNA-binding PadR family transcriptional regulator